MRIQVKNDLGFLNMRRWLTRLGVQGSFVGDVFTLASGTLFAQILAIVCAPLIARLFSPEAFGVAALFTSVVSIVSVIVCLRYELSICLPENDEDASNALAGSLVIVVLIALMATAVVFAGRKLIPRMARMPELSNYLWLLPLAVLGSGLFLALGRWATRKKEFRTLTLAEIVASFSTVIVQIGAGVAGWRGGGTLIAATVLGLALSALVLGVQAWRRHSHLFLRSIDWRQTVYSLRRYRDFPKYNVASSLLNALSFHLPTFLLSSYFSTSVVGQYALGNRLLRVPMGLIGNNIARVFVQRAAQAKIEGNLAQSVENTFCHLVALSFFPCFLLALMGRDIFALVFGERWSEAGVFTQILSPWMFFWFISAPLNNVFAVLEEQSVELRCQGLIFASRLTALLLGGMWGNARQALALFSVSGMLVYGYYSLTIIRKCGSSLSRILHVLLRNSGMLIPACLIVALLKYFDVSSLMLMVVSAILLGFIVLNYVRENPETSRSTGSLVGQSSSQQLDQKTMQ